MTTRKLLLAATAIASLHGFAGTAFAQATAPQAADANAPETSEIVVTARGREEKFQDVPLSVSAVSAASLQKMDIQNTNQLTSYVPSVQFSETSSGNFNGRLQNRPLVIRGLNLSNNFGISAAALIFLDGAPVLGSELAPGLDYERIEVLRGPQSVQFGRSTLSGAINYVTKDIGNAWHGSFEAQYASYDTKNLVASISGPLTERFKVGLSGAAQSNGGYYKNGIAGSDRLGARNTKSISGRAEWEPTDTIKIKAYANYFENDDGAPATAQVSAFENNCTLGGTRGYYCGTFPGFKTEGVFTDTSLPAQATNFIFNSFTNKNGRFDKKIGLQRDAALGHVLATWNIGDFAELRSLTAYEWDVALGANNGKQKPAASSDVYDHYIFSASLKSQNFSQELRLSSLGDKRLRWTAGASYIKGESDQQFLVDFLLAAPGSKEVNFDTLVQYDKSKSYGVFGGVYYDIFDPLTLSLEARYQWDERTGVPQSATLTAADILHQTFKSFSPRIALDYKITPDITTYISFSRGTRPGGFNLRLPQYLTNPTGSAAIAARNATVIADLTNQLGPFDLAYKEEKLTNYEIGIKGSAFDRRARFALDFYYGDLTNQQITNSAFITSISNTLQVTNNIGKTQIYGIEFDGSYRATDIVTFTGSFSWNKTKIKKYLCTACTIYTGSSSVTGNGLGGAPEYSGSLAVDARDALASTGWDWFGHADYVYRGSMNIDIFSDQKVRSRQLVNLRAGVIKDGITLEGFVTNLFNNKRYESYTVGNDYAAGRFTAFSFNVPTPRVFGGRVSYKF